MRLVVVHLPVEFIEGLDSLVRTQRYSKRSEAIRSAIRNLLKEESWEKRKLSEERATTKIHSSKEESESIGIKKEK